jgi:hypothetical protein
VAILEGGILGDGRFVKNPSGAAFSFSNTKRDLIDWVATNLFRLVISNPEERYVQSHPVSQCNDCFRFQTATWKDLLTLAQEWYQNADQETMLRQPWRHYRKQIPKGFRLSPLSGLLWYLGDGSLVSKSTTGTSQVIRFATHDLPLSRLTDTLIPQLVQILHCEGNEVVTNRDKRVQGYPEYGFEIYVPSRYVPKWLQFIGPCPETVTSYRYKWDYRHDRVRKRWLKDEIDFLREYWGRVHHDMICTGLNVTYEQARTVARRRCGLRREYSGSGKPLRLVGVEQQFQSDLDLLKLNLSGPRRDI